MPLLKLGIFLICAPLLGRADEVKKTLVELKASYDRLEGYQATFDAKTEGGRTGTIDIGVDFESGWAYVISELKDDKGQIIQTSEQWATGEGNYVLKSGDGLVVFEGLKTLGQRLDQLKKVVEQNQNATAGRINPFSYLDKENIQMGVGHLVGGLTLFGKAEALVEKSGTEVKLNLGELGIVTIDAATGLLLNQTIPAGDQSRTMTRVDWKNNPGKEAISRRMTFTLEGVQRRNLRETGMGRRFLREVLQNLIDESSSREEAVAALETYTRKIQDDFAGYLQGEALDRSGFIRDDFLFKLFESAMKQASEKLKAQGAPIRPLSILTTPESRGPLVKTFTGLLLQRTPEVKKREYLDEVLGGKLQAEGNLETQARQHIRDLVENAYFQVRIERAMDRYIQQHPGK